MKDSVINNHDTKKVHICPVCKSTKFFVSVVVTEDWLIDDNVGDVKRMDDFIAAPSNQVNDDAVWECCVCKERSNGSDILHEVYVDTIYEKNTACEGIGDK
jgi:hypothetical protein